MKAKVKNGQELLCPKVDYVDADDGSFIINLLSRTAFYVSFRQSKGEVTILTTEGLIELSFCSEEPVLAFDHQEKDQIVFNVTLSEWQQQLINA